MLQIVDEPPKVLYCDRCGNPIHEDNYRDWTGCAECYKCGRFCCCDCVPGNIDIGGWSHPICLDCERIG